MKRLVRYALMLCIAVSASAQQSLDDGVKDLADQLRHGLSTPRRAKIGVLPLRELSESESVLGIYLADELTTCLFVGGGVQIVDRQQLDRIMGELKLQQSGPIDEATAKKVGQLTGAGALITGTLTEFPSFVSLNCHVIDTETGAVVGAGTTKIMKDDDLRAILAKPLHAASTRKATPEPAKASPAEKTVRMSYEFTIPTCHTQGDQIDCRFRMTNLAKDARYVSLHISNISGVARSYLTDSEGKRYPAWDTELAGGSRVMFSSRAELQPNLPAEATMTFKVPEDMTAPKTAAVCIYVEAEDVATVVFKDVPISN